MALNGVQNGNGAAVGGAPAPRRAKSEIPSGHNLNGLIYLMYARHNFTFCSALIERCIASGCDLEYPYYVKGLIARQEGNPADAIKFFQKAVEYNSTNTECYREIAKTLYQIGRHKQSLEIFIRTETLLKGDCEIQYYIAKLLAKNVAHGQLKKDDAKEYYLKAINSGRHLASMQELAEIYVRQGELRKGIDMLENSLQINGEDVDVLTRMGVLHLMSGETQTAFTRLLDALVIDGSSPKLLLALGGILQARGDADGALIKYKAMGAEFLEEQNAEIWSNLGLCFMRNKKLIAAISCLRKSIWTAPLNFNGLFNLGYVFMKAGLFVGAFHTFAVAINLKQNHTEFMMLIGVCLFALNDHKNAMAALEKAANSADSRKYPLCFLNLAIACYQCGAYGRCRSSLDRYMEVVDIGNENDQQSQGMKNHLKVARQLREALKLITDDGSDEINDTGPATVAEGGDYSGGGGGVSAPKASYKDTGAQGPPLAAAEDEAEEEHPQPGNLLEDDDDADLGNNNSLDSLEGERLRRGQAGADSPDYQFMTVVVDVENKK